MPNGTSDSNGPNKPTTPQTQAEESGANVEPGTADQPSTTTSERKRNANRENSKHSVGPRTERGRAAIRFNALKYGFYATDVVIRQGDGQESEEEFDILLDGLRRYWNPEGVMEHCQVLTIAEVEWRQRRAVRAEVGEIRMVTDTFYARQLVDFVQASGLADGHLWAQKASKEVAGTTILKIDGQLMLLVKVREEVEQSDYVSDVTQKVLDDSFGKDNVFATQCHRLSRLVQYEQSSEERGSSDPERERLLELLRQRHPGGEGTGDEGLGVAEWKQMLLREIDACAAGLKLTRASIEQAETREQEASLLAHNLPSREFVDKLIRYESMLERKKEKAIKLLLQLQARRKEGRI